MKLPKTLYVKVDKSSASGEQFLLADQNYNNLVGVGESAVLGLYEFKRTVIVHGVVEVRN